MTSTPKAFLFCTLWALSSPLLMLIVIQLGLGQQWYDMLFVPRDTLTIDQWIFPYSLFLGYWGLLGCCQASLISLFVKKNRGYWWGFFTGLVGCLSLSYHEWLIFERLGLTLNSLEGVLLTITFPVMIAAYSLVLGCVQGTWLVRFFQENQPLRQPRKIRIQWIGLSLTAGISSLFSAYLFRLPQGDSDLLLRLNLVFLLGAFTGSLIKAVGLSGLFFQAK